jgi:hypothetical protein
MTSCYTPNRIPGGVAESADAPDLKSGDREVVWVRVPPPLLAKNLLQNTGIIVVEESAQYDSAGHF